MQAKTTGIASPMEGAERMQRRRFPFSFSITREGALYIAFVFLLSLASVNTGNNLLFIILAAMLSAILVSGIVSHYSLKQISISLHVPENVFVGERVPIKVTAKNLKGTLPSFSIRVEDADLNRKRWFSLIFARFTRSGQRDTTWTAISERTMFRQSAYFPFLKPGESRSELTVQSFPYRGLYSLQGFLVSTRFPFGFFRRGERIGAKGEVLVYPAIQEISSFFHMLPFLSGRLEGMRIGSGEDLFSIRKYQEGESARSIDWKATAKTGELMAREFSQEEEKKFCLILDTWIYSREVEDHERDFEKAVSLTASIAAHFLDEGAAVEFLTPRSHLPRSTGRDQLYRILKSLATVCCTPAPPAMVSKPWNRETFASIGDEAELQKVLSEKVFKIIITAKNPGSFPSSIWRSSHVIYFNQL